MTRNIALSRPAMSAIAAFLVLSTPSAFAQETPTVTMTPPVAAPVPQTPPTVPEPTTTAPVAVPQAAQPVAPKPVIRVPLDIAPAETTPAPKTAERAAAPTPRAEREAQRPAPRARPAATTPAATTVAAAPAAEAPLLDETAPVAAPATPTVEPIAEPAPAPVEQASTTGNEFPWELAGGAAALLIAGGLGLAFARRRRHEIGDEEMAYEYEPASTAEPAPAQQWVTPAYAPRTDAAPRTVPAFAAAPSGSMGRHEAMAMAGPTDDNPFATLNKRLKRARFLDRQERVAYEETLAAQKDMTRKPVSAWEIAQRPAPAVQEQEVRRPEPARVRTSTTFRPGYSKN
jgi:resuscitation-promoting factor RpfA